jgi:hypothetical protein
MLKRISQKELNRKVTVIVFNNFQLIQKVVIINIDLEQSPNLEKLQNFTRKDFQSFQKTVKDLLYKKMKPMLKESKLKNAAASSEVRHFFSIPIEKASTKENSVHTS